MVLVDGVSHLEFGLKEQLAYSDPATPDQSNDSIFIPKQVGEIYLDTNIRTKPLEASFISIGNYDEAELKMKRFLQLFYDDLGKPKEVKFQFSEDKQTYYYARINGEIKPVREPTQTTFTINLIAYKPHRYSVIQNDELTWGSEVVTFENHTYTFGHDGGIAEFDINGNETIEIEVVGLALQPTIHLEGSATDLVIENDGKKIHVGTFTNATWRIETEKYIAYQNGNEKILRMDLNWMLRNGNNKVKFTGSQLNMTATIRFRDRWQ